MKNTVSIVSVVFLGAVASGQTASAPPTPTNPVVNTHHGVAVTDEYQWLENWNDEAVQKWSEAQNTYARAALDSMPNVAAIRARVTEILSAPIESYSSVEVSGGKVFAMKRQPPKQQPFLIAFDSLEVLGGGAASSAKVLVDPNKLNSKGTTAIDWFVPSPDGRTVAVSVSEGGSEAGDVHLFDTETGEELEAPIIRVQGGTAGGALAWLDDKSFLYTRYPREGEKTGDDTNFYVQVHRHTLGEPEAKDVHELGKDFPKIAEIDLKVDGASGRALATVQLGDGGQFSLFVRDKAGTWKKFAGFEDKIVQGMFGPDGSLLVMSLRDAPRGEILRLDGADPSLAQASKVVTQGKDSIVSSFMSEPSSMVVAGNRLFLTHQTGGPSEVRVFGLDGEGLTGPAGLPVSTVSGLTVSGKDVLYNNSSYVQPAAWYRFNTETGATARTGLFTNAAVNFDDCEVVREFASSKDGTKVPVNIIRRKGTKLDGSNPVLVNGYGGYGVNITPRFRALDRLLLEQGVVYAVANIRGGGEFGEEWHLQGNLLNKQNVFDDFAAAVKHMTERGYTTPERTAIIGGSNGGLLMGATFTQNPGLVKAVVSSVGIYDMLRVELSPNGAFNVPEFGTVKDKAQFAALHAYSPYHRVVNGQKYPSILFLTGANDPRVDPMHSRKMTARLQAASPQTTVLLRTSMDSGHGLDTSLTEQIAQQTDIFAFLFRELGVEFRVRP